MTRLLFLNENTLGHSSYLPRFVEEFTRQPALGIEPEMINVAPLPPEVEARAADPFRGTVRLGLSTYYRRWREEASRHAAQLLQQRLREGPAPDALVVNTQSVGLDLPAILPPDLPLLLCLDATFTQLRSTAWFAPNAPSRWLQSWTIGNLIERETALLQRAHKLLPWSQPVARSLQHDYNMAPDRIFPLPPSLHTLPERAPRESNAVPRLLFIGGDFQRKGGPLLVECFQHYFQGQGELHIVTQTAAPEAPGITVHRNIQAWSEEWLALWHSADLFVFPSRLETFGIVILEAHSFGVPVIANRTGAAAELLAGGEAGWLLEDLSVASLRQAIAEALAEPSLRRRKAQCGQALLDQHYRLAANSRSLASLIQQEILA